MARVLKFDEAGVPEAISALRHGQAVFLPNADPCYAVAAGSATAVNQAKRRRSSQTVASWLPEPRSVLRTLLLSDQTRRRIRHCLQVEGLTVLVPAEDEEQLDPKLKASYAEGAVLLYSAHLPQIRPILDALPWLYASSGNRTQAAPAQNLGQLLRAYTEDDEDLIVLDGDTLDRGPEPHGSTTMLKFEADGRFEIVRPGIQDRRMRPTFEDVGTGLSRYRAALQARLRALR